MNGDIKLVIKIKKLLNNPKFIIKEDGTNAFFYDFILKNFCILLIS
jgi:hypothetical protein